MYLIIYQYFDTFIFVLIFYLVVKLIQHFKLVKLKDDQEIFNRELLYNFILKYKLFDFSAYSALVW